MTNKELTDAFRILDKEYRDLHWVIIDKIQKSIFEVKDELNARIDNLEKQIKELKKND